MNKESKLNLNAGDYAISHCDSNKTYNGLEVHKMLCDAYIAGNNDTLDDKDEEIRKALINVFATHKDYEMFFGVSVKDIRAWLEEQGEKSNWKPSNEEMDVLYGLAYITNQYDEHKEEVITRLYQDLKREFFNGSSYENMFPNTEDDVRRRSTIQVLEYARSLDTYNQYGKADINKNIAWLEKQGEKKLEIKYIYPKFRVGDVIEPAKPNGSYIPVRVRHISDGSYSCESDDRKAFSSIPICDENEYVLTEQRPADKSELKFKVGDWVVYTGYLLKDSGKEIYVMQVASVEDNRYNFTDTSTLCFDSEKDMRLWTIQDAKDGDVLNANGTPFIYKKHDKDYVYFYCGVNLADEFVEANGFDIWNNNNKVYPATKEQRDKLERAMFDAGYRWNKEELKLEKI